MLAACGWSVLETADRNRLRASRSRAGRCRFADWRRWVARGTVQRLGVCGGGNMTGRAVSGWGIVDGLGVAAGRNARGRRGGRGGGGEGERGGGGAPPHPPPH